MRLARAFDTTTAAAPLPRWYVNDCMIPHRSGDQKLSLCRGGSRERDGFYFGEIELVRGMLDLETALRVEIDGQPVSNFLCVDAKRICQLDMEAVRLGV